MKKTFVGSVKLKRLCEYQRAGTCLFIYLFIYQYLYTVASQPKFMNNYDYIIYWENTGETKKVDFQMAVYENLRYREYKIYTGNYECKKCKNVKTCG